MRLLPEQEVSRRRSRVPVRVRSHSGFRQGEYPKSIFLDGAWRPVEAVVERWLEEEHVTRERRRCFVVRLCRREGTIRVFQCNEKEWFLDPPPGGGSGPDRGGDRPADPSAPNRPAGTDGPGLCGEER